ncbi:Reverse transcriptase RNA-dependent DNA polymerase [Trinorchestia longiramus]|nr:Reverse transcriptase RNA-dependent DNA polymerase [Trinorchestia longiramus]
MKMENGQNLQDHLKVFVELFEELAIIGDAMEEEERVIILLSSLPGGFSTLVTVLEAHEKIPAWEVVTERLLNEERRQRGGPGTSDSSEKLLVSFKKNKKFIKGFECGKEGHIKKQCRVSEERLKKENKTFQATKAVDARSSSTGETIMFTSAFPIGNTCIYTRVSNKGLCIIAVYVDDIIIASDCLDEINEVKPCLSAKYKMKDLDADWAGDRSDRKSTSGYCFTSSNSVIIWRSVKQSCVALSTTEAEYVALAGAAQEAI